MLVLIVLSERRQKCSVTKEYQFLELKKKDVYQKRGRLRTMFTNAATTKLLGHQR
jgi:hypothetical protein